MGLLSFIGGIHPPHAKKASEKKAIIQSIEPKIVRIPLRQHIGAPCDPTVAKGDYVKVGQEIGEVSSFVCAPVHSSVSGTVVDIKKSTYWVDKNHVSLLSQMVRTSFMNQLSQKVNLIR